ncbi:MAG: four helix bundle protein [Bacteroidales bacterium]
MKIRSHEKLDVYRMAFENAMRIFHISRNFPVEERYSLTDQLRRSSRSVCSNLAEAFRKRKYPRSFVAKLSDSESEAAETIVWLDFSLACQYMEESVHKDLKHQYDFIIGKLVNMALQPEKWTY